MNMPFGKSKIDANEVINIELEKRKYILWKEQKKSESSLKKVERRGDKIHAPLCRHFNLVRH